MRFAIALFLCFVISFNAKSQHTIHVIDKTDLTPVSSAGVIFFKKGTFNNEQKDLTDEKGICHLPDVAGKYKIIVSHIGYYPYEDEIEISDIAIEKIVKLGRKETYLDTLIVTSKALPVEIAGDTLTFNASAIKVGEDATTEELLTKYPGVTIENGTLKINGEQVTAIMVNGERTSIADPLSLLKNLPASILNKAQYFERQTDQAVFTGVNDGNGAKTINLITKKEKGTIGKAFASAGTSDNYNAGINATALNIHQSFILTGFTNNTSQNASCNEDNINPPANNTGRVKSNGIDLSFSNSRRKNIKIDGGFSYNSLNNERSSELQRFFYYPSDSNKVYRETDNSISTNTSINANLRIEYNPDSTNSLIGAFSGRTSGDHLLSSFVGIGQQNNFINANSNALNSSKGASNYLNTDLAFRHRFSKKGRTISLSVGAAYNESSNHSEQIATNLFSSDSIYTNRQNKMATRGTKASVGLNYTEPFKSNRLQISYSYSYQSNDSRREVFDLKQPELTYSLVDTALSSNLNSPIQINKLSILYSISGKGKNYYNVGFDYQLLEILASQTFPYSNSINKLYNALLPQILVNQNFSKVTTLRLELHTITTTPTISQLQPVINNTNPILIYTGNMLLKQAFNPSLTFKITHINAKKGQNISLYGNISYTANYIANAQFSPPRDSLLANNILLSKDGMLMQPINLNNYFYASGSVSYGSPLEFIKCFVTINMGYSYRTIPSMINDIISRAKANVYSMGINLASNFNKKFDFTISSYNYYNTVNSQRRDNFLSGNITGKINFKPSARLILNSTAIRTFAAAQVSTTWNAYLAYKFLRSKSLESRIGIFNILKQTNSYLQTINDTYAERQSYSTIGRFIYLSVIFKINNF
ncbi:hypothetical protein ACEN9X_09365 [Mucilaginibacter sp. Mucisp86]|uniref:hypothetical protein n=1 Tax=Mucilaginibacter sp. Mucisp86 TaxID=3243060 RepID=UPI0039B65A8C